VDEGGPGGKSEKTEKRLSRGSESFPRPAWRFLAGETDLVSRIEDRDLARGEAGLEGAASPLPISLGPSQDLAAGEDLHLN